MKKPFFYSLFIVFAVSACSKHGDENLGIDPNGKPRTAANMQPPNGEIATGDGGAFIDPFGRTKANMQGAVSGEARSESDRGLLIDPNGKQ